MFKSEVRQAWAAGEEKRDRLHSRGQYGRCTRKSRDRDQVRTPALDFLQVDSTPLHVNDRDC